jgi:UDP-N-acetylmuramate dehydrogenase
MREALRGRLRYDEPMARHSTWRVGGPADRYYEPAGKDDLRAFLVTLPEHEPLIWVGLGSNLLVRDGGIRGTVVATAGGLDGIERVSETELSVEAGASCARVARETARMGLTGAEYLAGIPGTMGGALAMNAGAYGAETWRLVQAVETVDRAGQVHNRLPAEYRVAYRSVEGPPDEWFLAARLALTKDTASNCLARMREHLDHRARTQPLGRPNCGSVFRNPPGDFAARLIETAGLKGLRQGGCHVSAKHANFIINDNNASAADIEALIERVRQAVLERHGVSLVPEVRMVGERTRKPPLPGGTV